jgi:hypothetical protein
MQSIFQRRRTWHRKQRQSAVLIPRNQVRQLKKENSFCIQRVSKKYEIARTRFICSAEHNLAMRWRIGFRPNVSSVHNRDSRRGRPMFVLPCFAKIKLRVVQFRGLSKTILSSLQAQAPLVILSGFSPPNCTERTERKPACQTCQLRAP